MKEYTKDEIEEIKNKELSYVKAKDFFRCKNCIDKFSKSALNKTMSPREYGMYEVSKYTFRYPRSRKAEVIVVWCKRCGRNIWDSRDLVSIY